LLFWREAFVVEIRLFPSGRRARVGIWYLRAPAIGNEE
jgi:hypothetical protein